MSWTERVGGREICFIFDNNLFYVVIPTDDFTIATSYSIPPERSHVDIVLTVLDDDITEDNENRSVVVAASVPGISLGNDTRRTVGITILDDEGETDT